jgi:hypothetical protein
MSVHDLESFRKRTNKIKKSELILKDLQSINRVFDTTIEKLKQFKHYVPAKEALVVLHDNKMVLGIHISHHTKIVEGKE